MASKAHAVLTMPRMLHSALVKIYQGEGRGRMVAKHNCMVTPSTVLQIVKALLQEVNVVFVQNFQAQFRKTR